MSKRKSETLEKQIAAPPFKKPKISFKETFADPTYDETFKMLFGTEANKDILISILNSLLNFSGDNEIKDVTITSNDLFTEGVSDIKGSVDVLCTTKGRQKIAVEMQKQYKNYFLPRSQEYMAKLLSGQVKDGQGAQYNTALMDTYILSIGKQNIFRGPNITNNKNLFEKTVVPCIIETGQEVPGNKMHWKFYELPKFVKSVKNKIINQHSSLKEQWLDFLIKCGTQQEVPNDISEIIKKGYDIMKIANWNEDQRTLYWKQKATELHEIEEQRILIEDGETRGKIKGEIDKISFGLSLSATKEQISNSLIYTKENYDQIIALIQDQEQQHSVDEIYQLLYETDNDNDYLASLSGSLSAEDDNE